MLLMSTRKTFCLLWRYEYFNCIYHKPILQFQIIFRLYDGDSNNVVTKKEISQISSIITQPEFADKFDSGVISIMKEVDTVQLDK